MPSSSTTSTHRVVAPASRAARTHGETLASWSRTVTTTSSSGPSNRLIERDSANASVVMFGPNTTSPGSHPSRSAPARRAPAITWSVSPLVAKAPPALALERAR